jgi:hypothetical protein
MDSNVIIINFIIKYKNLEIINTKKKFFFLNNKNKKKKKKIFKRGGFKAVNSIQNSAKKLFNSVGEKTNFLKNNNNDNIVDDYDSKVKF